MANRTKRMKAPEIPAPATREEAEQLLSEIGQLQREVDSLETRMNHRLAAVKEDYEAKAAIHNRQIERKFQSFQAWAETNRPDLLEKGMKSTKLKTGDIGWRMTPKSVSLRGVDAVIKALKTLGLQRFIRTKEEVDKNAILKEPETVAAVKGITISQKEEFWIRPFESQIERANARKVS